LSSSSPALEQNRLAPPVPHHKVSVVSGSDDGGDVSSAGDVDECVFEDEEPPTPASSPPSPATSSSHKSTASVKEVAGEREPEPERRAVDFTPPIAHLEDLEEEEDDEDDNGEGEEKIPEPLLKELPPIPQDEMGVEMMTEEEQERLLSHQ
jgi:hypothetical protein